MKQRVIWVACAFIGQKKATDWLAKLPHRAHLPGLLMRSFMGPPTYIPSGPFPKCPSPPRGKKVGHRFAALTWPVQKMIFQTSARAELSWLRVNGTEGNSGSSLEVPCG
jgi:hypothetical protein